MNIDHVATLRNARGSFHPDPLRAAHRAREAGADGITAHLREDRRHINDDDMRRLRAECGLPLNFEMAATDEMVAFACALRPHAVCLVPEKREERTTEGGLDAAALRGSLAPKINALAGAGIRVSLFIAPEIAQIDAARALGAPVVEFHTGPYCEARGPRQDEALRGLREAVLYAASHGIECHAGHGLSFDTVGKVAALPQIAELNIGHFLVGEAIFSGLGAAIATMKARIQAACSVP